MHRRFCISTYHFEVFDRVCLPDGIVFFVTLCCANMDALDKVDRDDMVKCRGRIPSLVSRGTSARKLVSILSDFCPAMETAAFS
jgi:hypothetical protein